MACGFVGGSLGWVSVGPCGWPRLWSVCCEGLVLGLSCGFRWVVWFTEVGRFGCELGLGFGVARVLLVGQTVPDHTHSLVFIASIKAGKSA